MTQVEPTSVESGKDVTELGGPGTHAQSGNDEGGSHNTISGQVSGSAVQAAVVHGGLHFHNSSTPAVPRVAATNLPPRNPAFAGRSAQLAALGDQLATGRVAVAAVRGLGGVGKSQLALEHAHRGRAVDEYDITWWVRAESPLTLAEDLTALASAIGVPPKPDQEETVRAVVAALALRERWLLVYDNAESPTVLRPFLASGPGHVVITSRERGWGGLATQVDLEVFRREETVAFLHARTGRDEPEAAEQLATELGDLPLAVAQAAAYIDTHSLSIGGYLGLFHERRAAALLTQGLDPGEYPHSVATTWLLHFDDLSHRQPAAVELLRLCAFLDPDEIPLDLLLSQPDLLPDQLAAATADPTEQGEAVGALTRTHLVTRLDDDRLRVHRLVQTVTRHHLNEDEAVSWASRAVALISELFPDHPERPHNWPVESRLAAHARTAVDHATEYATVDPADTSSLATNAGLLNLLGLYLWGRAEHAEACRVLERALAMKEAAYGPDHPDLTVVLNILGAVYRQLGNLPDARHVLERALAIAEAAYGSDHPDLAITLNTLGAVYRRLGNLPDARHVLERALAIEETAYGPDHPHLAIVLNTLGAVYRRLGNLPDARHVLERALAIKETAYGANHPDLTVVLNTLGTVYRDLGDLTDARHVLERALFNIEAAYGPTHPDTHALRRMLNQLGG